MISSVLKENREPQISDLTYYKQQGDNQCISKAQQQRRLLCSTTQSFLVAPAQFYDVETYSILPYFADVQFFSAQAV